MKKQVSQFFRRDYCNYASYDNQRKISSLMDGLKNASRKALFAAKNSNISDDTKVDQFTNTAANKAMYIHGPGSLANVVVGMTQQYTGSNNISWFKPEANFGTRLLPTASSSRYIFLKELPITDMIYPKQDDDALISQVFENVMIEPKYFIPIIPMLFVNGDDGVTPGFRQYILARDPKAIITYLKSVCQNKTAKNDWVTPFWNGFKGTVESGATDSQWLIKGVVNIKNTSTVEITELPIGYSHAKYLKVLDDLEEKKAISSYQDLCDTKKDTPNFIVKFERKVLDGMTENDVLQYLKLIRTVSETYTAFNELGRIEAFSNIQEMMDRYVKVRLSYYDIRKSHQLNAIQNDIDVVQFKISFIEMVLSGEIDFKKHSEDDIKQILSKKTIKLINDSYDYLLDMSIRTLTESRLKQLIEKKSKLIEDRKMLEDKDIKDIWLAELKELERRL